MIVGRKLDKLDAIRYSHVEGRLNPKQKYLMTTSTLMLIYEIQDQ